MGKIIVAIVILAIGGLVFSFSKNNQKAVAPEEMSKTTNNSPEKFTPPTTPPPVAPPVTGESVSNVSMKEITIKASSWKFEPSEIRVKEGDLVKLTLEGVSGTHALSLPDFGVKSATVSAGQTTTVEFVANKKGTFSFKCSVFCGEGHAGMTGNLIVE